MRVDLRRRIYIAVALLGIGMCVLQMLTGPPGWRVHVTFPVLTGYLVAAVVVLARSAAHVVMVERTGFWFVLAVWSAQQAVGMLTGPAATDPALAWAVLSPMILLVMVLLVVMAYVWYPTRVALWVSLVPPGVSTALGFVRYVPDALAGDKHYLGLLVEAELYLFVTAAFVFLLATNKDLLAASRSEADRLRRLAHEDALTGLANRRGLLDELGRRRDRVSLISVDLDHFKAVNDTFGHATGDAVLVEVAALMRLAAPDGAVLSRWGGEEFVIALPSDAAARAYELAERMREMLATHPFPAGVRLTASFGVSAGQASGIDDLIATADERLYRAKGLGRNRVA